MAGENVDLTIRAKNATEAAFKAVSEALKALEEQTDGQSKKTKGLGDSIKDYFTKEVDVLDYAKKGAIAAGAAIAAATAAVIALGIRGATVADVAAQFDVLNTNAGNVSATMLTTLRTATGRTISDFELMKGLNEGLSQGMRLNVQDAETLGKASRVLADRVGGDTATAYNTLIAAMATGRDKTLQAIGLNIDAEAAVKAHANAIGIQADRLTEAQKKTAIQNAILAELRNTLKVSGEASDDFGDRIDRMKTSFQNVIDRVAVVIGDSPVLNAALEGVADALDKAIGGDQAKKAEMLGTVINKIAFFLIDLLEIGVNVAGGVGRAWGALSLVFNGALSIVLLVGQGLVWLVQKAAELGGTVASSIPGMKGYGEALKTIGLKAGETNATLDTFQRGFHAQAEEALEAVKGNSAYHEGLDKIRGVLQGVKDRMSAAASATREADDSAQKHTTTTRNQGDALAKTSKEAEDFTNKLRSLNTTLAGAKRLSDEEFLKRFGDDLDKARVEMKLFGVTGTQVPADVAAALERLNQVRLDDLIKKSRAVPVEMSEGWQKAVEQAGPRTLKALETNLDAWVKATDAAADTIEKRTLSEYDYQVTVIKREADAKKRALDEHGAFYKEALVAIDKETDLRMTEARDIHNQRLREMTEAQRYWSNGFRGILAGLPGLLQQSLTGGGGMEGFKKAIASQIGGAVSSGIFGAGGDAGLSALGGKIATGVGNKLGSAVGMAVGAALPGIGALAGPLISKGLGAAAKGLGKLFGFGESESDKTKKARNEWLAQFDGGAAGLRKMATEAGVTDAELRKLFDTKKTKDFEAAAQSVAGKLKEFGDQQAADQERLQAAIEKYGFTIDDLGPKFRQQKLDEQAKELIEDWRVLRESGIDLDVVNGKMAASANDYLQVALRTGAEVPAAMRPILESMASQGLLTDANGNKITDLKAAGVTFAETLTQGFDRVVARLDKMLAKFGEVTVGINAIPSSKQIDIVANYKSIGDIPDLGYDPGVVDVPGAAAGGMFSRPTFRVIAEREPEIVGSPNVIVDALAQAMKATGGAPAGVGPAAFGPITVPLYFGTEKVDELVIDASNRGHKNGRIRVQRRNLVDRS